MSARQFRSFPLGLLLTLCLLLAGCIDIQIRLVVHADGSGIVMWDFEIAPETAALGVTAAGLKAELLKDKNFRRPDAQIREGRAANGNQTLMATVPVEDVSQISSSDFRVVFARLPDGKKCSFNLTSNNDALKTAMVRIRMDVEMPGKIVSSNADQVTGNVAHFATVFRPEALYVEAETSSSALGDTRIIAGSGALAVLAFTVFWAWRRRQGKQLTQVAGTPGGVGSAAGTSAVEPAFVYCGDCGAQNRSSSKFCRRCGGGL